MPKVGWFGSRGRFIYSNNATAKMGLRRFVCFREWGDGKLGWLRWICFRVEHGKSWWLKRTCFRVGNGEPGWLRWICAVPEQWQGCCWDCRSGFQMLSKIRDDNNQLISWWWELLRYWSWFWAGPIRRVWRVIKEGLTQLGMQGFQKEVEGLKKEERSPNWGVQMASSAVLIIPSVFLVAGEYLFLLHTKLYHLSWC